MPSFIDRLLEEKAVLDQKIEKLSTFLVSEKAQEIDSIQLTLLNIQQHAMLTYSQCLLERINLLQAHNVN